MELPCRSCTPTPLLDHDPIGCYLPHMERLEPQHVEALLERFLRYVKIETTSDRTLPGSPSTKCQWDLLNLLRDELNALGIEDLTLDQNGFLIARIPPNLPSGLTAPTIGFMAHVDTAGNLSGKDVKPQVIDNYDGGRIPLGNEGHLDPDEFPELLNYKGERIVTTDGTTLLGGDDKTGVAVIVTLADYLKTHPNCHHGEIELIFTPDEETGRGMDLFPLDSIRSRYCYTMDGGALGEIETECFNGYLVTVEFIGKSVHPGEARGRFINATTVAAQYTSMLPGAESPEATDGRYGFYCPIAIQGGFEKAELTLIIRDFEEEEVHRRINALKRTGEALECIYPGVNIAVHSKKEYLNMQKAISEAPLGLQLLDEAVRAVGIEPRYNSIRGGTDGCRLTEMGVPTPNVFAGVHNLHSRYEWVAVSTMARSVETIIQLVQLWTGKPDR